MSCLSDGRLGRPRLGFDGTLTAGQIVVWWGHQSWSELPKRFIIKLIKNICNPLQPQSHSYSTWGLFTAQTQTHWRETLIVRKIWQVRFTELLACNRHCCATWSFSSIKSHNLALFGYFTWSHIYMSLVSHIKRATSTPRHFCVPLWNSNNKYANIHCLRKDILP